jgi:hypothetical protein
MMDGRHRAPVLDNIHAKLRESIIDENQNKVQAKTIVTRTLNMNAIADLG